MQTATQAPLIFADLALARRLERAEGHGGTEYAEVRARGHSALLRDLQDRVNGEGHGLLDVWMSHGDKVTALPSGFRVIASNAACAIAGMANEERRFYGVQFHPEVTHTLQGKAILERFVLQICGLKGDWNMPDYI